MLVVFAALVLAGATTSSIGIPFLSQDGAASNRIQLGDSQMDRSEQRTLIAREAMLSIIRARAATLSPLGAAADLAHRYSSGGFFETVVFFNSEILHLGQILPQSVVFSAYWWTPVVFLFFFLPRWFGQVTGVRRLGWLAALLIFAQTVCHPAKLDHELRPSSASLYPQSQEQNLLISAFRRFQHGQRYRPVALSVAAEESPGRGCRLK